MWVFCDGRPCHSILFISWWRINANFYTHLSPERFTISLNDELWLFATCSEGSKLVTINGYPIRYFFFALVWLTEFICLWYLLHCAGFSLLFIWISNLGRVILSVPVVCRIEGFCLHWGDRVELSCATDLGHNKEPATPNKEGYCRTNDTQKVALLVETVLIWKTKQKSIAGWASNRT